MKNYYKRQEGEKDFSKEEQKWGGAKLWKKISGHWLGAPFIGAVYEGVTKYRQGSGMPGEIATGQTGPGQWKICQFVRCVESR